jgi:hypothetical protein
MIKLKPVSIGRASRMVLISAAVFCLAIVGWTPSVLALAPDSPYGAIAQATSLDRPLANLPAMKPVTIYIEGEPQQINTRLYNEPGMPMLTYYPETLEASGTCDSNGCSISFTNTSLATSLLFLFPAEATTVSQVEPYLIGENGLFTQSGWTITRSSTNQQDLPYPWMKKMVNFQAPNMEAIGVGYFGEQDGQAFAAVEVFPPEAGDGFAPRARIILSELQLK